MTRVSVRPRLLEWARERAGLAGEALADRFPKLGLWEQEKAQPTMRQLEDSSRARRTHLGYFFLAEPPEERLAIPDFRTLRDHTIRTPSPDLLETVQAMERRCDWLRDFLIEEGHEPLAFIRSAPEAEKPARLAETIRTAVGLPEHWADHKHTWEEALRALRAAIDDLGVLVVINGVVGNNTHRRLDVAEFRGFVLVDDYAPLIFVNGADGKAAQVFTLAHELVHLWIGQSGVFNLPRLPPGDFPQEQFCHQVAAELLLPEAVLREIWPQFRGAADRFQRVARRFKVSELVAARRAMDLGLIDRETFFEFYDAYEVDLERKTKKAGGDFWATQDMRVGTRFGTAVVRAAREGRLLYRDAYELTGLRGRAFDKYARELGFGAA